MCLGSALQRLRHSGLLGVGFGMIGVSLAENTAVASRQGLAMIWPQFVCRQEQNTDDLANILKILIFG